MAAEGKAIIFYRCNLFILSFLFSQHRWKTDHRNSTKLGQYVKSGVDLQMPPKILRALHQIWGAQNITF